MRVAVFLATLIFFAGSPFAQMTESKREILRESIMRAFGQMGDPEQSASEPAGSTEAPAAMFDYAEAAQRLEAQRSDAIPMIRPAAERGDPGALFLLGLAHAHGFGVSQDPAAAERLMREASERGFAKATATLGILLISGENDFRKDPHEGLRLAQAAAGTDEPRGLVALAIAYAAGLVPGKGEADAEALVGQAARAGDRLAQMILDVAEADRLPDHVMSKEEAEFFDLSRAGPDKVAHIIAVLDAHPDVADYYYRNVPPHPDCLRYWHRPGVAASWHHSKLVCTIHYYYHDRIIRNAQASMRWADSNIQVENFRHHREQAQRTETMSRTSRDMREGYYQSYGLGGPESQGFPSDARNW